MKNIPLSPEALNLNTISNLIDDLDLRMRDHATRSYVDLQYIVSGDLVKLKRRRVLLARTSSKRTKKFQAKFCWAMDANYKPKYKRKEQLALLVLKHIKKKGPKRRQS